MATAMITGPTLDATMSTKQTLERAIELIDPGLRERSPSRRRRRQVPGARDRVLSRGGSGTLEYWASINPGSDVLMGEEAWTAVVPDGSIEVYTPQMPHGQSHETTYGQIVADELGVARHDVKIVYGDTNRTPFGFIGTGGSRGDRSEGAP